MTDLELTSLLRRLLSLTNSTLRQRFLIEEKNYPMASRIIADAVDAGLVKAIRPGKHIEKVRQIRPVLGLEAI